jgi:hypothetical protein
MIYLDFCVLGLRCFFAHGFASFFLDISTAGHLMENIRLLAVQKSTAAESY